MRFLILLAVVCCGFVSPDATAAGIRAVEKDITFKPESWRDGMRDWHSVFAKPCTSDWRGFDRLVIDVTQLGDDGDQFGIYVFGSGMKGQEGLRRALAAPAWETVRWEIPLAYWQDTKARAEAVSRIQIYAYRPLAVNAVFSNFTLLRKGETPPPPQTPPQLVEALRAGRAAYDRRKAEKRAEFVRMLKSRNERDGICNDAMLVGVGTAMDQVRPKDTYSLESARSVDVRLARNEWEGRQIFVTPLRGDIKNVSVAVSPLLLDGAAGKAVYPADAIKVSPMGYVKTTVRPRYKRGETLAADEAPGYRRRAVRMPLGWWPDMILDFLSAVDVKDGDVQSFWISVNAPEKLAAGVYRGTLRVSADGVSQVTLPFSVRVNNFTLPRNAPMPVLVNFTPAVHKRKGHEREDADRAAAIAADPESPLNMWKKQKAAWGDFLAAHYITMAPLYQHRIDDPLPYDIWKKLKAEGRMGPYNLCYFGSHKYDDTPESRKRWERWCNWQIKVIRKRYEEAQAHGLADHCLVYCCDEARPDKFPFIDESIARMKAALPSAIRFATTSFNDAVGTDGRLRQIDVFIPQTVKFNSELAEKARADGRKVWWYYANEQLAPHANAFTDGEPIEQRLLMGAMAARYRPDGFLYYQSAYFNSRKCVTSGPNTDWNPESWRNQHGDATWMAVGPGGVPLTTQRLENFRDGLEDLAYVKLAEAKSARPVKVPETVFTSLENFNTDPSELMKWRDRLADFIEGAAGF